MLFEKGEPWLRGTHANLPSTQRALIHALEQTVEDVMRWTEGMSGEEMARTLPDVPSVAFQLRHLARSIDRLVTYAEGGVLTSAQYGSLSSELAVEVDAAACFEEFHGSVKRAKERVLRFKEAEMEERRYVGRERIPTTTGGILIHTAEHMQRHVGQLITTVKVMRAVAR